MIYPEEIYTKTALKMTLRPQNQQQRGISNCDMFCSSFMPLCAEGATPSSQLQNIKKFLTLSVEEKTFSIQVYLQLFK